MNYFELYPGDYMRDTAELSLAEHGAYLLLMCSYYANERALPAEYPALHRIARAMNKAEQAGVNTVADRYFPIGEDGLRHNARADREIAKAIKRINSARENGKNGGRPAKPKSNPTETQPVPGGLADQNPPETHSGKALHTPPVEQKKNPEHVPQAARFDDFWAVYPIKRGKKPARDKWKAKKLDAVADRLIADVRKRIASDKQWRDGFAPHAATYLHQERWEDELAGRSAPAAKADPPRPTFAAPYHRPVNQPAIAISPAIKQEFDALIEKLKP